MTRATSTFGTPNTADRQPNENANAADSHGTLRPSTVCSTDSGTESMDGPQIGKSGGDAPLIQSMDPLGLLGRVLNERYEVSGYLGHGSFGHVYRGHDLRFHRNDCAAPVAIKFMRVPQASKNGFEREAQLMKLFQHHQFVQVFDFGSDGFELSWLVMEYLPGRTLEEILQASSTPVSKSLVIQFAEQVLTALHFAHRKNLVHRDLKPANIMVMAASGSSELFFKVMDFGTSANLGAEGSLANTTMDGAGTPAYMAPEQISSAASTAQSDIYSVGVMLFRLFSGKLPFDTDVLPKLLYDVIHTPAPPLSSKAPRGSVSPQLNRLIDECLAKKPDARPIDLLVVRDRLLLDVRKDETRPRWTRVRLTKLAAIFLLMSVTTAWLYRISGGTKVPQTVLLRQPVESLETRAETTKQSHESVTNDPARSNRADSHHLQQSNNTIDSQLNDSTAIDVVSSPSIPAEPTASTEGLPSSKAVEKSDETTTNAKGPGVVKPDRANNASAMTFQRGLELKSSGQLSEAIEAFNAALLLDPELIATYHERANLRQQRGDLKGAIDDYNQMLKIDSGNAIALNNRGSLKRKLEQFDEALVDLTEAIRLDPELASAFNNRGILYRIQRDYDRAASDFNEAIRLKPNSPQFLTNRGNLWRDMDDFDRSLADYDAAYRLDPTFLTTLVNRGVTYRVLGKLDKAISDFQQVLSTDPHNEEARAELLETLNQKR